MQKVILLVEDDWPTADGTTKRLNRAHPDYSVVLVDTELGFRQHLLQIEKGQQPVPAVVICDTKLAWTSPSRDQVPAPPDVVDGTSRRAGLRCWQMFREEKPLRQVPWIHHSVTSGERLGIERFMDNYTSYLEKDFSSKGLHTLLKELLPQT